MMDGVVMQAVPRSPTSAWAPALRIKTLSSTGESQDVTLGGDVVAEVNVVEVSSSTAAKAAGKSIGMSCWAASGIGEVFCLI